MIRPIEMYEGGMVVHYPTKTDALEYIDILKESKAKYAFKFNNVKKTYDVFIPDEGYDLDTENYFFKENK